MNLVARLLFVLGMIVTPIVVYATSAGLPERVATHFGRGGLANGWMSHGGYVAFMLAMTIFVPATVAAVTGLVPAMAVRLLRKRSGFLTAHTQEAMVDWLAGHASLVGILISVFMLAIHFMTLEANARTPARLDESTFYVVLVGFVALLAVWMLTLALRLRRAV